MLGACLKSMPDWWVEDWLLYDKVLFFPTILALFSGIRQALTRMMFEIMRSSPIWLELTSLLTCLTLGCAILAYGGKFSLAVAPFGMTLIHLLALYRQNWAVRWTVLNIAGLWWMFITYLLVRAGKFTTPLALPVLAVLCILAAWVLDRRHKIGDHS